MCSARNLGGGKKSARPGSSPRGDTAGQRCNVVAGSIPSSSRCGTRRIREQRVLTRRERRCVMSPPRRVAAMLLRPGNEKMSDQRLPPDRSLLRHPFPRLATVLLTTCLSHRPPDHLPSPPPRFSSSPGACTSPGRGRSHKDPWSSCAPTRSCRDTTWRTCPRPRRAPHPPSGEHSGGRRRRGRKWHVTK